MIKDIHPEKFITMLRATDEYIREIYTMGSCFKFALFMYNVYEGAEIYINDDQFSHCIVKIDGNYYDIDGPHTNKGFRPILGSDLEDVKKWSFARNRLLGRDCPNCDEKIPIELFNK